MFHGIHIMLHTLYERNCIGELLNKLNELSRKGPMHAVIAMRISSVL